VIEFVVKSAIVSVDVSADVLVDWAGQNARHFMMPEGPFKNSDGITRARRMDGIK